MAKFYTFEMYLGDTVNFLFLNILVALSFTWLFQGLRWSLEIEEAISTKLNEEHYKV